MSLALYKNTMNVLPWYHNFSISGQYVVNNNIVPNIHFYKPKLLMVCSFIFKPVFGILVEFSVYKDSEFAFSLFRTFHGILLLIGGNCEEELPKTPVGRQLTDRLPTVYRQLTDRLRKKKN